MEFNDGNQWHFVTNPTQYKASRTMYEFRATSGTNRDTQFSGQRGMFKGFPSLMYHFPYESSNSPEWQADHLADTVGALTDNDMFMLDSEGASGLKNPADFSRRFFARLEARTDKLCWQYVPSALAGSLTRAVTGNRIVKAPRYSGNASRGAAPTWPYDVHQYTDRGGFPGSPHGPGDCNFTTWTTKQLVDRCNLGAPVSAKKGRTFILLDD